MVPIHQDFRGVNQRAEFPHSGGDRVEVRHDPFDIPHRPLLFQGDMLLLKHLHDIHRVDERRLHEMIDLRRHIIHPGVKVIEYLVKGHVDVLL